MNTTSTIGKTALPGKESSWSILHEVISHDAIFKPPHWSQGWFALGGSRFHLCQRRLMRIPLGEWERGKGFQRWRFDVQKQQMGRVIWGFTGYIDSSAFCQWNTRALKGAFLGWSWYPSGSYCKWFPLLFGLSAGVRGPIAYLFFGDSSACVISNIADDGAYLRFCGWR